MTEAYGKEKTSRRDTCKGSHHLILQPEQISDGPSLRYYNFLTPMAEVAGLLLGAFSLCLQLLDETSVVRAVNGGLLSRDYQVSRYRARVETQLLFLDRELRHLLMDCATKEELEEIRTMPSDFLRTRPEIQKHLRSRMGKEYGAFGRLLETLQESLKKLSTGLEMSNSESACYVPKKLTEASGH